MNDCEPEKQGHVTVKEYLEAIINHNQKYNDERTSYAEKALRLQAEEYGRRLDALNHEAAQLKQMQTTYLPRETYESDQKTKATNKTTYIALGISLAALVISLAEKLL
jgi:hypothetical protein